MVGASVADACALGGCSRATLFCWRERFENGGLAALLSPDPPKLLADPAI
ncbi:MAG: helix-turn-helix domain-containing protein [Chloroflexi bacterium]|nr:helix-turn-helix domain-containing protein [Chloroflexota bacterium]